MTATQLRSLSDYLPLFAGDPLLFAPGTSSCYSNAGYIVLGLVIERVSGDRYQHYTLEHVANPAGMKQAEWFERDALPDYAARGYVEKPDHRWSIDEMGPGEAGTSAGGGYATATDLASLAGALRRGELLGALGRRELATRFGERPPSAGPDAFAGLDIGGGAPGVNAALCVTLNGRYTLAVLANQSPPAAAAIANTVRKWAAGF
jgi:CubicO group peptidase (beta-lactamase class C family)